MNTTYRGALAGAVSLMAIAVATGASAGGFALKERSTIGQGMSFAGVTAGSAGIESIGFNPAAVTMVKEGTLISNGASLIQPIADGTASINGESVDPARFAAIPNLHIAHRLDPDLWVGLSIHTPFGLVTSYNDNSVVQFDGLTSKLQTFQLSPMIGIEPIDGVSLGLAGKIMYANARLTSAVVNLEGDQVSGSFAVGAMFDFIPDTTIGISYDHGYDLTLRGNSQFGAAAGALNPALAPLVGLPLTAQASASLPATISGGIVHNLTDDLRVMGEVQYQLWSVFDAIDTEVLSPLGGTIPLSDEQNYEDVFFVSVGGEYDVNDALTVRAGAAWDQSPTIDGISGRTVRVPDEDRVWLSLGGSYALNDHTTINAGYSYLFTLEDPVVTLRNGPAAGSTVTYDGGAHIFSIGATMKF